MFSDSYPIKLVDGVMYEVTGKVNIIFQFPFIQIGQI